MTAEQFYLENRQIVLNSMLEALKRADPQQEFTAARLYHALFPKLQFGRGADGDFPALEEDLRELAAKNGLRLDKSAYELSFIGLSENVGFRVIRER